MSSAHCLCLVATEAFLCSVHFTCSVALCFGSAGCHGDRAAYGGPFFILPPGFVHLSLDILLTGERGLCMCHLCSQALGHAKGWSVDSLYPYKSSDIYQMPQSFELFLSLFLLTLPRESQEDPLYAKGSFDHGDISNMQMVEKPHWPHFCVT